MDASAIESVLLQSLEANSEIADSFEFATGRNLDHQKLVGSVKSLEGDAYVVSEPLTVKFWELTIEGTSVVQNGSPEFQVFSKVEDSEGGEVSMASLQEALGELQ